MTSSCKILLWYILQSRERLSLSRQNPWAIVWSDIFTIYKIYCFQYHHIIYMLMLSLLIFNQIFKTTISGQLKIPWRYVRRSKGTHPVRISIDPLNLQYCIVFVVVKQKNVSLWGLFNIWTSEHFNRARMNSKWLPWLPHKNETTANNTDFFSTKRAF